LTHHRALLAEYRALLTHYRALLATHSIFCVLQYFTTVCVDCVALSLSHTQSYAIFTTYREQHIAYSFYTVVYYSLCRLRNPLSLSHTVLQYFTTVCVYCVTLSLSHTHSYAIFTTYRATHSIFISI